MKSKLSQCWIFLVACAFAYSSFAVTEIVDGIEWTYVIQDGEASVGDLWVRAVPASTTGMIKIPASLGGCPVTSIGDSAFLNCKGLVNVTIPSCVTRIDDYAFRYCSGLTSMTVSEGLKSVGKKAFEGCANLLTLSLSASVEDFGHAAVFSCPALKEINVDRRNKAFASVDGVLYDYAVAKLIACPSAKRTMTIPASVTWAEADSFPCESLEEIKVSSGNKHYVSRDGVLYDHAVKALIACPGAKQRVTIPQGVTVICNCAFSWCSQLESVAIPASVKTIEENAFSGNPPLQTVYVDRGDAERVRVLMQNSGFDTSKVIFVETTGGDVKLDPSYGPFVPGEKVSLSIPALAGYSAKGLPSGLQLGKKAGTISGTPKKPTGDAGVTVTFTKKGAETLTAQFVVSDWPQVSFACPSLENVRFVVGVAGDAADVPLEIEPLSAVKSVKASKLPSGMKLVKDKQTGAYLITGAPKKAGDYTVTLTLATTYGSKQTLIVPIHVEIFPLWAVGTFIGVMRQVDRTESGEVIYDEHNGLHDWYDGPVKVTVSSSGKVSGVVFDTYGKTVAKLSFPDVSIDEFGALHAAGAVLSFKDVKADVEFCASARRLSDKSSDLVGDARLCACETQRKVDGKWRPSSYARTTFATDDERPLRQDIWKSKSLPLPPSIDGKVVQVERDGYLYTMAFGKNGAATDSLARMDDPGKDLLKKSDPIFSVVSHGDGVWHCELFSMIIVDAPGGGEELLRCEVRITDGGDVTCTFVD